MEYPDVLDISNFIDKECVDNTNCLYELYGIINHAGYFDFGHYYTYIKFKKKIIIIYFGMNMMIQM